MVRTINQVRQAYGLPGLRPSYSLYVSAKLYSRRMMRSDYFGHLARIPVAAGWSAAGETLEWHQGWRLRPRRAVSLWMHSQSHRAVLLSRRFRSIGVGQTRGYYGSVRATMWVAHLGRR
jgi:uncharacterized protein YkwD